MRRLITVVLALTLSCSPQGIGGKGGFGGKTGFGGGAPSSSLSFGAIAVGTSDTVTTVVATNASGSSFPNINLPTGALAFGVCAAQGTGAGTTFTFTDTAGNTWSSNTLQFHSTSGSVQVFYTLNAVANAADVGTCTISATIGGGKASAYLGYATKSSGTFAADVTTAGNNADAGSSTTAFNSATFSTTNATELVIMATEASGFETLTSPLIGGSTATLLGSDAGKGGLATQGVFAVQYLIPGTTISSGTANLTGDTATRWVVTVASWHN